MQFDARIPATSEAPCLARAQVRRWLGGHLSPDRLEVALLIVSELASIAVRDDPRGTATLRLAVTDWEHDWLVLQVADPRPGRSVDLFSLMRAAPWLADGLLLIARLAERWGLESDHETMIWAEIAQAGAA